MGASVGVPLGAALGALVGFALGAAPVYDRVVKPGETVDGRYVLERLIGRGAMADNVVGGGDAVDLLPAVAGAGDAVGDAGEVDVAPDLHLVALDLGRQPHRLG